MGVITMAACAEQPTAALDIRSRSAATEAVGNVAFVVKVFEKGGGVVERGGTASVRAAADGSNAGPSAVRDLQLGAETRSQRPASGPSDFPTFGYTPRPEMRDGRPGVSMRIPTRRVATQKVDGHTVEIFAVVNPDRSSRQPVGMITAIDGRASQYVDFETVERGRPTAVRVTQLGTGGEVLAQMRLDVHSLAFQSRVSLKEQDGLRRAAHRLLRGVGNLVLPDVLHAQRVEDDPCSSTEQFMVGALAAQATAGLLAQGAALACGAVPLFACGAFLILEAAFGVATVLAIYATQEWEACRAVHPECWDGNGYMTNGSCDAPGTGTGTGNGGGDPGSGNGHGNGNGNGSPDIVCGWWTWYTYEDGLVHTHTQYACI